MSISSDGYEEIEYRLLKRIKVLEQTLQEIQKIADIKFPQDDWSYLGELYDIYIVK